VPDRDTDIQRTVRLPLASDSRHGRTTHNSSVVSSAINIPQKPNIYSHISGWNAMTDGVLTLAPVVLIWGLRTTRRAKWGASILLGFSSLAMAAAIWRTVELDKIFIADWDFTCKSE
jgi:hypothetical protein